jgi:ubiquinol-cytochrome c reductase cytochrome b subunit
MHSNGASFFFILLYLHMFKAVLVKSYSGSTIKLLLWYSGVIIFILSMATAFMGYVLPWGQMSFWAATVITNLFTAIPSVGDLIAYTLWGGFSVSNNTLNRFYTLHFVLPFIICFLVVIHLILLHAEGSTNILGVRDSQDLTNFYPYFFYKDLFAYLVFLWAYFFIVCFYPNVLSHPDNYIKANPLVTPTHIVPE